MSADRKPGSYPPEFARVANLGALPAVDLDAVLQITDLGEIWGIGRRPSEQLRADLKTALDVARLDAAMMRRRWSVVLERTVRELQGLPCNGERCRIERDCVPPQSWSSSGAGARHR